MKGFNTAALAALLVLPAGLVSAQGYQLPSQRARDYWLAQLTAENPLARVNALKALKQDMGQPKVRAAVAAVLLDKEGVQGTATRVQAAKTLSWSRDNDAAKTLLAVAQDNTQPTDVRAMAYKALWSQSGDTAVRAALLKAADKEDNRPVRLAAVWALFGASQNSAVSSRLLKLADKSNPSSGVTLRVEALKSLYKGMGQSDVRAAIAKIAKNKGEDVKVREAAVLLFSAAPSSKTDKLLNAMNEQFAKEGGVKPGVAPGNARLQNAVTQARRPSMATARYFHLDTLGYVTGQFTGRRVQLLDPLENE